MQSDLNDKLLLD